MAIVEVNELKKNYGKQEALKGLSFFASEGEIYGIIGPDGAGKTTLFRILTTLLLADSGEAKVNGLDVKKDFRLLRKQIGYMPGKFSLYQDLTVEENLQFFASIFKTTIQANYYLIEDIYKQIEPFKNRKAGKLSGGMKQKLALSCALIHKPTVLFLDEPTTGVDPVSRQEFWQMLKKLKTQGITIIVSTPYMDEASMRDTIAFIHNGKFLKKDTPQKMIESYSEILWVVKTDKMHTLLYDLRDFHLVKTAFSFGEMYHITMQEDAKKEDLQSYLQKKGNSNIDIQIINASIED